MTSGEKFNHGMVGSRPPCSTPRSSNLTIPWLERDKAAISCARVTRYRSTLRGTGTAYGRPNILIHMHRALWRWPAIIRMVRFGAPGIVLDQSGDGRFSKRKTVTRLLVRQAVISASVRLYGAAIQAPGPLRGGRLYITSEVAAESAGLSC